ncbi:MAG: type II toxin-antitoxin system VapC family toxin [Patescibacteria group bacterium]
MPNLVLDASFLVRALTDGNSEACARLKTIFNKKNKVFSSPILPLEVANALRFSLTDSNVAKAIFAEFLELPIKVINLNDQQKKKIIDISYKTKTTVYDTSYHVLAKSQGATFLTCDVDYYKKAETLGDIELLR